MSEHTRGDWYACPGKPPKADCDDPLCTGIYVDLISGDGDVVSQGVLHADGERITPEQARANAILMAQAPRLLKSLEEVTKMLSAPWRKLTPAALLAIEEAEKIIAAAKGEGDG